MCELRADWWSPGGGAESPEGDNLYACPAGAGLVVAFGVAESPEGDGPYGSPPGPYFSMKKSRQKSLGECPETPDASVHPARKAKGRLPGAGLDDAYKVPQAHFYVGTADRVPLPRCGEGGRGCGAERRQWRMQRGGAPAAVEKIEQASSAKIFSGTARRQGLRLAQKGPRRQPNSPLFPIDSQALFDYYGVGKYPPKGVLKYE